MYVHQVNLSETLQFSVLGELPVYLLQLFSVRLDSKPLKIYSYIVYIFDTCGYLGAVYSTGSNKDSSSSYFVRNTTEEQQVYLFALQPNKLMLS